VTATNDPHNAYGLAHIRPYAELQGDLTNNAAGRYNFIIPDDCHNMHTACSLGDPVLQGDTWLAQAVPQIVNSEAFKNGGALFILFDESYEADTRLPVLLLSPFAKGDGYGSTTAFDHSAFLRTVQDIFSVRPYLGAAATATNLSDLFSGESASTSLQIQGVTQIRGGNALRLTVSGIVTNVPLIIESSSDLILWAGSSTNLCVTPICDVAVTNPAFAISARCFYRATQILP
jgi:hypothetical protein